MADGFGFKLMRLCFVCIERGTRWAWAYGVAAGELALHFASPRLAGLTRAFALEPPLWLVKLAGIEPRKMQASSSHPVWRDFASIEPASSISWFKFPKIHTYLLSADQHSPSANNKINLPSTLN